MAPVLMGFDAHCHRTGVGELPAHGVTGAILAGVTPMDLEAQLDVVRALEACGVVAGATVGVHPWHVAASRAGLDAQLYSVEAVLKRAPPGLVGVGETGLDGARQSHGELQHRAFETQLDLARSGDWPLVLHVVRAHGEAQAVVRRMKMPSGRLQVHGFTGSAELARSWVALGAYISIGGPATWHPSRKRVEGIRAIPDEWLLVETDAPDQPVRAARLEGRPGRLADLESVLASVAAIRGQSVAHIVHVTTANAHRLFRLDRGRGEPL